MAVIPESAQQTEDGKGFRLPVSFELPGSALLSPPTEEGGERPEELRLEFYLYVLDSAGAVVAHRAEQVDIDLATVGELLYATGLRLRDAVVLPEGRFSLRFLAVAPATRRYALVLDEVTLERRSSAPALTAPRFAPACDSWLEARSARALDLASMPAARSVLRAGQQVAASAALVGLDDAVDGGQPVIEMQLRPVGGAAVVEGVELDVESVTAGAWGPEVSFRLSLPEMPLGRYETSLEWSRGETSWRSPPVETWILDSGAAVGGKDCVPPWGEVYRLAATGEGLSGTSRVVGSPDSEAGGMVKRSSASCLV